MKDIEEKAIKLEEAAIVEVNPVDYLVSSVYPDAEDSTKKENMSSTQVSASLPVGIQEFH